MDQRIPVYIGRHAIAELIGYCQSQGHARFTLIADQNTYAALGHSVEQALRAAQYDVIVILLSGEVVADERYIVQVLLKVDRQDRVYLAVGSGTLTDITRFVSHRTKSTFCALPTAPSVDGFTSLSAPLVLQGLKQTVGCHSPLAVFADLPTLAAAPQPLIAAGFGDMVGKLLSVADWRLGHLLWDEPSDEEIAQHLIRAANA
jgi:glycerol-1-phosphate dehydrogenase [NAD(P)+]